MVFRDCVAFATDNTVVDLPDPATAFTTTFSPFTMWFTTAS
jgi:hypothetical protein